MTNLLTHNCVYVCVQQGGVTKVANKGCKVKAAAKKSKGITAATREDCVLGQQPPRGGRELTRRLAESCKGEGCSLKVKGGRGLQMDEGREP
jgi:hypothetical protein